LIERGVVAEISGSMVKIDEDDDRPEFLANHDVDFTA